MEVEAILDLEPPTDAELAIDLEPTTDVEPAVVEVGAVTDAGPAAADETAGEAEPWAEEEETEDVGREDPGPRFADELDFLESLSLGETGPFDAVSAMLDEEESASDGPQGAAG